MPIRWTREQRAAITSTANTLLAASAGTGKTTTIVGKILWSLGLDVGCAEDGTPIPRCADPCRLEEIAAITFTEKAAHDLQARLRAAIETSVRGPELRWELERATVGTIHSFAAELLREHALRLGIDPTFRIVDARETETRQDEVVREVLADALRDRDPGAVELTRRYGLTGWKMWPGAVGRIRGAMRDLRWRAHRFDEWSRPVEGKRHTRELDLDGLARRAAFAGHGTDDPEARAHDRASLELSDTLYRLGRTSVGAWLTWLERENARDFDSLILDARRLLSRPETASALREIRRRLRLLVIDEFQDTDRAQWDIARAIAGLPVGEAGPGERPHLVLVGDPKQSIYRFRGADIRVWNEARSAIESEGTALELSSNFRSEPRLVDYVNRVGETAITGTARALSASAPESVVRYRALEPARPASPAAGLEWLAIERARVAERQEEEARRVAGRIHGLIDRVVVVDPDDGTPRRCRASDIAILGRRNDDLAALEPGLRTYGIPLYNAATSGLSNRQEVLDLVTALRVIANPADDLRAFAWLRSPFVGLRDEVLARIALDDPGATGHAPSPREPSLLERAEGFLEAAARDPGVWFPAPGCDEVSDIERAALARGLDALAEARALADRADHAEVVTALVERTGYRDHLLLRDGAPETLANIERFLALLEEYRHLALVRFLALWDRWGDQDLGIPQARLYSSADDVVTLSTIHAAKGLEWPIVFLVGTTAALAATGRFVGSHWMDPVLGPVFLPRAGERGPRADAALARRIDQEKAEEARLLYVAATRARDRLVVVGPVDPPPDTFAAWLGVELPDAREAHEVPGEAEGDADTPDRVRRVLRARVDDAVTGTGRQIDAFGDDEPQFDLFDGPSAGILESPPETPTPMIIRRGGASLQTSLAAPPVTLAWLGGIEPAPVASLPGRVPAGVDRLVGSATERMLRERDPAAWSRRYEHGVLGPDEFLADPPPDDALPATARGTLIHGVLERIRAEEELSRVLDETIASLDLAELELDLEPGSRYREALEREIASVVRSPEWQWYVEGTHFRELRFLHRAGSGWTRGAFDLLRPAAESAVPAQVSLFDGPLDERGGHRLAHWVIDFKTHRVTAAETGAVAERYRTQANVYRSAAAALLEAAEPPRVALHFTHPNAVVEL